MKINFFQIFKIHPDGSIEPIRRIKVGGIEFGPGIHFTKGVKFGGIDFADYIGRDFEVDEIDGVFNLKGIY